MKYFSILNSLDFYNCEPQPARLTILGKKAVCMTNARSGKQFYTKPFPTEFLREVESDKGKWVKLIRRPLRIGGKISENYIWPSDIIDLSGNQFKKNYALLLPFRDDLGGYEPMSVALSNTAMDCRNFDINANTRLAENLIEAWCKFNDSRYLYHEFSFNNMFCNMDNKVMFDFSFSAHEYSELSDGTSVPLNRIHPDYTDVYYYQRKSAKMDVISNYFSMAVILFRLLIGLLPYQGRLLEGIHNITKQEHSYWIMKYHQNPYFIFDENENVNRISSTVAYPELYEERWNRLPPLLKGMFAAVFNSDNALRKVPPVFYTPNDWKNAI
ncbi:MAG: hypothetical protein FWH07_03475 [Oscillospiraceae bacterium]|nr:hypothetical protein [Oscillospiraceae bacterium]